MSGCEMMKCTNYDNGRCTYRGDTCKYRGESLVQATALLDRIAELEVMLSVCQGAINSLEEDALGYANDGDHEWPTRDELLSNIDRVLSNAEHDTRRD